MTWSSRNQARAVDAAFRDCVIAAGQLEREAEAAVGGTLDALRDIDDALLVRLRQDLESLPATVLVDAAGRDRFQAAVAASIQAAADRSRPQLARAVTVEVASITASELVARLVLRGAATSGLIGASVASAPVSLGVGLATGLAVNHAVSRAIDRWADPWGTLIGLLNSRLSGLRRLVLGAAHGDDAALALMRHGALAEPLVAGLDRPAARALAALAPRQARRLAILADSGELARIGRTSELLAVVARFGDRAMAFVWDHKGGAGDLGGAGGVPGRPATLPQMAQRNWPGPSPGRWPRGRAGSPSRQPEASTGGSSPPAPRPSSPWRCERGGGELRGLPRSGGVARLHGWSSPAPARRGWSIS